MSGAARLRWPGADPLLAACAAVALGGGVALAMGGVLGASITLLALGSAAAALGLLVLFSSGWVDALTLVALTVPLPAIYSSGDLRIAAPLPLTLLAVSAWVLQRAGDRDAVRWGVLPVRSLVALAAVFLVATAFGRDPLLSARELLNFGVLLAFLVAATDLFERRPSLMPAVAHVLVATAGVCGALAVLQSVGVIPSPFVSAGTQFNRAALGFGQPNGLGLFLALVLPFAVATYSTVEGGARRLVWLAAAAIVLGLLATFSRGSWLSVVFGAFPVALAGQRRFLVRVCAGGVLVAIAFDLATGGALQAIVARTAGDWSIAQRAALMWTGVLTFLANPILGVGPGGFVLAVEDIGLLVTQLEDIKSTPHNAFIQMAAETGAIGLTVFVVFLVSLARALSRRSRAAQAGGASAEEIAFRRAALWSFGVLVLQCLLDWPFPHGTGQVAMLILAMGCTTVWREPACASRSSIRS